MHCLWVLGHLQPYHLKEPQLSNCSLHIIPPLLLPSFGVLGNLIWKIVKEERPFGGCELSSLDFIFIQSTSGPWYDAKRPPLCLFDARSRFWFVCGVILVLLMVLLEFGELLNHLSEWTNFWTFLVLEKCFFMFILWPCIYFWHFKCTLGVRVWDSELLSLKDGQSWKLYPSSHCGVSDPRIRTSIVKD